MNVPPTKESGSNARLIADQFVQPLPGAFEQYPGTELRRTLGRAYIDLEAERDALREAIEAAHTYLRGDSDWSAAEDILRAALERPE